jgi:shikimate dehydrogenase
MIYTLQELNKAKLSVGRYYLVVGNPIGHSLSPMMHTIALNHYGLDAEYHALQLMPNQVTEFIALCNRDQFGGCNITIPYKQLLLDIVDELSEEAAEIGAINTIVKDAGKLIGHNTDVYGFVTPIEDLVELINGGRAIVFGTGGASKAVKSGLIQLGIEEIIFVSRSPSKRGFKDDSVHIEVVDYSQWTAYAEEASIFVNTTPVGMYPNEDELLIQPDDAIYLKGKICYDLIYNPIMTSFLKLAENAGGVVIDGLDMFICQGSRSFELWTGKQFPVKLIKEQLIRHFSAS